MLILPRLFYILFLILYTFNFITILRDWLIISTHWLPCQWTSSFWSICQIYTFQVHILSPFGPHLCCWRSPFHAINDGNGQGWGAYWNLMPTVAPLYMMRYWGRHKNILSEKIQTSETHLGGGIIAVKMGGHICGNNFYRKYAPPEKSSHKTWQIYVIFSHLKCQLFCDIN